MDLPEESRARIRAEEEYRHTVFAGLNRRAKPSAWDRLNSPISIWGLGSLVLGLISFLYSEHSDSLRTVAEARTIAYGIQARLAPVEILLHDVLAAGAIEDGQRYRLSNSFTGKMEQAFDSFGQIGVPGLLFRYAAVSGNPDAAQVARDYWDLLVPLEKEGLYSRGSGSADGTLTDNGRKQLERLKELVKKATRIASDATK